MTQGKILRQQGLTGSERCAQHRRAGTRISQSIARPVGARSRRRRMALGADASSLVRTIVRDAGRPLVIGLGAGTVLAFHATRLVQSYFFQTSPHDSATFAVAAGGLALTAIAAAWWPARRAACVDPVAALRAE